MVETLTTLLSSQEFWLDIGRALLIIVGFGLAARLLLRLFRTVLRRYIRRTDSTLDDALLKAIGTPSAILLMLVGLRIAMAQFGTIPEQFQRSVRIFFFLAFALVIYILIYRVLHAITTWYVQDFSKRTASTLDDALAPFVRRLLLLAVTIAALVLVLQYFRVPIGSLLATLGIGSLAVALAAQSTLSDLFAGFFIMLDRRYRVGDRIELIDADLVGDVVDIGLRTTRILTMDHRMVIVPNALLASNVVINHAYPDPNLRVDLPVGVAYGADIDHTRQVIIEGLEGLSGLHPQRKPDVIFTGFGNSALDLEVRCWINAYADKPKLIGRINERIYRSLNEAEIEIPFPQRVVWMKQEGGTRPPD